MNRINKICLNKDMFEVSFQNIENSETAFSSCGIDVRVLILVCAIDSSYQFHTLGIILFGILLIKFLRKICYVDRRSSV